MLGDTVTRGMRERWEDTGEVSRYVLTVDQNNEE